MALHYRHETQIAARFLLGQERSLERASVVR
jgi:hypothetical protein